MTKNERELFRLLMGRNPKPGETLEIIRLAEGAVR
jgi:hypothetical protein